MFEQELIAAAREGNHAKLKEFLDKRADANARSSNLDEANKTALQLIIQHGDHKDAVEMLLNAGASMEALDAVGNDALHYATLLGRQQIISLLSERSAKRNAVIVTDNLKPALTATTDSSSFELKPTHTTLNSKLKVIFDRITKDVNFKKVDLSLSALVPETSENKSISEKLNSGDAIALANALRNNSSVTDIDLSHNNIDNDGATALMKVLEVNKKKKKNLSILILNLTGNPISEEIQKKNRSFT